MSSGGNTNVANHLANAHVMTQHKRFPPVNRMNLRQINRAVTVAIRADWQHIEISCHINRDLFDAEYRRPIP